MRLLVTGGAGFVGSGVAIGLAQRHSDWEIVALDNLRRRGDSKLKLQEMGSRYLFIVLYVWLEAHLSRDDYRRKDVPRPEQERDEVESLSAST